MLGVRVDDIGFDAGRRSLRKDAVSAYDRNDPEAPKLASRHRRSVAHG